MMDSADERPAATLQAIFVGLTYDKTNRAIKFYSTIVFSP